MKRYDFELVNKWSKSGLLEHLSEPDSIKMAHLLEVNYQRLMEKYPAPEPDKVHRIKLSEYILPLTRRLYEQFLSEIGVVSDFEMYKAGEHGKIEVLMDYVDCNAEDIRDRYYYRVDCEAELVSNMFDILSKELRKEIDSSEKQLYIYAMDMDLISDGKQVKITIQTLR